MEVKSPILFDDECRQSLLFFDSDRRNGLVERLLNLNIDSVRNQHQRIRDQYSHDDLPDVDRRISNEIVMFSLSSLFNLFDFISVMFTIRIELFELSNSL